MAQTLKSQEDQRVKAELDAKQRADEEVAMKLVTDEAGVKREKEMMDARAAATEYDKSLNIGAATYYEFSGQPGEADKIYEKYRLRNNGFRIGEALSPKDMTPDDHNWGETSAFGWGWSECPDSKYWGSTFACGVYEKARRICF